ncbi:MAG: hypothetical protein R2909_11320 [Gemmatimonadales bacterium]
MRTDLRRMKSWASILTFVLAASTGCERNPVGPGVLASIEVVRSSETLLVGTSVQFTAVGRDVEGNRVGVAPVWSVAGGGGTVSESGLFTAGTAPGSFPNTVTATVGSLSGTASVTVQPGPPASITVSPTSQSLTVGATQQFTAVVKDGFGNTLAVQAHWSVASGGGAISSSGLFTAGTAAGGFTNTVVASIGNVTASASITVTAGALATITVLPGSVTLGTGGVQQFTAEGADASGNPVAISPVWTVAAGGGTINATGRFTAGAVAGSYPNTVTATAAGVIGRASVTVSAGAAASITISPTTQALTVGASQQFSAVVRDQAGNVLPLTPTWSVVAGGGTISSSGVFTAGTTAGSFANTVRAAIGAVSATASITVTAGPLAVIAVTPNLGTLAVGATVQLAAAGRDGFGNSVAVSPNWSVVAGGGTISASGLFTAGTAAGQFTNTVRACSTAACGTGSVAGFASVAVSPGPLATLTIAPTPVTVGTGASQSFTLTGRDAGGNPIAAPGTPTWSVLPGHAGGTILATGVYAAPAAVGPGFDSVRVAIGAVTGFARVNLVASGALASIVVTPNPVSVVAGATQQFVAVGYDGSGVPVPTPGRTWSLVPPAGVGTIGAATGLFTAGTTQGSFQNAVRATSGAITGYASVTVTASADRAVARHGGRLRRAGGLDRELRHQRLGGRRPGPSGPAPPRPAFLRAS